MAQQPARMVQPRLRHQFPRAALAVPPARAREMLARHLCPAQQFRYTCRAHLRIAQGAERLAQPRRRPIARRLRPRHHQTQHIEQKSLDRQTPARLPPQIIEPRPHLDQPGLVERHHPPGPGYRPRPPPRRAMPRRQIRRPARVQRHIADGEGGYVRTQLMPVLRPHENERPRRQVDPAAAHQVAAHPVLDPEQFGKIMVMRRHQRPRLRATGHAQQLAPLIPPRPSRPFQVHDHRMREHAP